MTADKEKGLAMRNDQKQVDRFNMRGSAIILNLLVGGLATTVTPFDGVTGSASRRLD